MRNPNPSSVSSSAPIVTQTLQARYRLAPVPSGDSGDVTINTDSLSVTDGALVDVRNDGPGNAGTLRVNASSIFLDNQGGITAATASGEGGNISLEAENLFALGGPSPLPQTVQAMVAISLLTPIPLSPWKIATLPPMLNKVLEVG